MPPERCGPDGMGQASSWHPRTSPWHGLDLWCEDGLPNSSSHYAKQTAMPACTRCAVSMLTDFFTSYDIEATARRTGFVQRAWRITGKLFLALVTLGTWSAATTTLAQLAAKITQLGQQMDGSPSSRWKVGEELVMSYLEIQR
jgi:hypothetical protein